MKSPIGFFDQLIDPVLQKQVSESVNYRVLEQELESGEAQEERKWRLIQAIGERLNEALQQSSIKTVDDELKLLEHVLEAVDGNLSTPYFPRPLKALKGVFGQEVNINDIPETGLRDTTLFTAGKGSPSLLSELRKEMTSVDQLDILVSFITWSGVRKISDLLEKCSALDGWGGAASEIRILTTTYTGATEARAIDYLAKLPGVKIKVSLDGRRTRLHAKAWIFKRSTQFGSAYVGSANLSGAALTGGLEWTLKITQNGDSVVYDKACAHFETLWNDNEFQPYDANNQEHFLQLEQALKAESGNYASFHFTPTWFAIEPKAYQITILDELVLERSHGRSRNLLIAATGTGKTCMAAFDYQRTTQSLGGLPKLLFVAHRKEILYQARATFAQVLRRPDFGDVLADGSTPKSFGHLFATIQSLQSRGLVDRCGLDFWHTVIVDECHHSAAKGYDSFLSIINPSILLGLTATPERGDGQSIMGYFDQRPDGRPSAELLLWDALEQELLAPFEYYACADETDLSEVPWDRVGESRALDTAISGNHVRARLAIEAYCHTCSNPLKAKALAFCVSIGHAKFMADAFVASGVRAEVIVGDKSVTSDEQRQKAPARLASGELNVICTCDLYNEGIDIPSVDTLLFLRPTQSPVVFQQQLGRGLRLAHGKESCVVIDLVGRYRKDFRFDRILGIMTGLPKQRLVNEVEVGFNHLPPGCHIQLDRISKKRVIDSLREACNHSWSNLAKELSSYSALRGHSSDCLVKFLSDTGVDLTDIYPGAGSSPKGWTALRRKAGLLRDSPTQMEKVMSSKVSNLIGMNDPNILESLGHVASGKINHAKKEHLNIIAAELFPSPKDPCTGEQMLERLNAEPEFCSELIQIADLLLDRSLTGCDVIKGCPSRWPLVLHGRYGLRQIAIGTGKIKSDSRHLPREGVIRFQAEKIEMLLVTLDKSSGFKVTTNYHDYAIAPDLFHWQSQNSAGPETKVGRRYCPGGADGWSFQLFVRENKEMPYCALGEVVSQRTDGSKPMSVVFRLLCPMPNHMFERFSVLRAS